jgi:serine phosphatase RsbU (regulator of sigma subunit)/putative methionine-R-sulfoxide reductase with GAF domain
MALHASLQIARERWHQEQLALVRQVGLQIADVLDIDELARRVTNLILSTFDYYYVAIFTLEPSQDILHFRASAGSQLSENQARESYSPTLVVHKGQGIIGYVAQTGQEIVAGDVLHDTHYQYYDALPETRSEVALPLKVQDRVLGVLDVQSDHPDDFADSDVLVLRALAGNIAIAVEGARLFTTLRQRTTRLQAIYETSSAITSILDQDQLLNEVVSLIQKRFGYPFVHLFTIDPVLCKITYAAGSGARSQFFQESGYSYDLPEPSQPDTAQGLIPWVTHHGETALVNDVSVDPRYRPSPLPPDVTLSELTVPLIFGGKVLGVLDVQSDRLNAFGEEDRFLFEALAGNIAIAMRNAYLYSSEAWRRQVADSLREVAGLLSADVDLDQVLEAILIELERTLPLDVAAIWLLDAGATTLNADNSPSLKLAAMRGKAATDLELEIGLDPVEILECNQPDFQGDSAKQALEWLLGALMSDLPVVRAKESSYEPLGAALDFPSDYSAIAAPLRVGDQPLGVLTLIHRGSGRYGDEAEAMSAAFASYAAVAIENTRLYEAAHEQAWISTVLLQVAEATQSFTNLNELLDTVIRITPTLAGVGACLLYILDDDGTFIPATASGLNSDQRGEFERWRFAPGDAPALDRLLVDRHPVVLGSGEDDLRLTSILLPSEQTVPSEEENLTISCMPSESMQSYPSLLVLVPMVARNEVLGAFLVEYRALQTGDVARSLETFLDEKLAILQGIAHQTAIAVDNIQLLKTQKEEAYVSVALLQVAQSVVSSSDLDEALGSVVRITPILVGIRRAVIYLWDQASAVFRLAQAYGLPRTAGELHYTPEDFPLLGAVLQNDSLAVCPFHCEESGDEEVPQAWTRLPVPTQEMMNQYLENEICLLIAFPLSVKGNVLGVLLIEEPEPLPIGELGGVHVNLRLREKRMEIITGISQQAALAIQNDRLQREMVERERLERELQLAREIQRAFLPQSLPDLPGWDLKVYWRTAREVGGDFYDVFELPGKRLGLVISDVADKGMPAALFMTLVRTLMRATVQGVSSPADVLKRVNRLLVPDAPRGMFVTMVYVILSLETGILEYANAGHNPPFLLRSRTCQLERLGRTGMALGVQTRNRIEENRTVLDPGDYLVMYTDGLTDAFSPDGEPFGEARLWEVVEQSALCQSEKSNYVTLTAQDLLQVIGSSLESYTGGAAPTDDLTIVILRNIFT